MTFEPKIYRHSITFEIPDEDFDNILGYESANYREFELPVLSTMLDQIDGVDSSNYSGHFGRQVFADFDVDDDGQTPQVADFQELIDDFLIDARRLQAIIPEVMTFGGRHDVELVALYGRSTRNGRTYRDGRTYRELVYGDDDFLIATGADDGFSIFHREGGELQRLDVDMPPAIRQKISHDRDQRSFHRSKRKQITMSKDIKGVREWVSTLIPLDVKVATVDISDHPLAGELPNGARPLLKHAKFIVADTGPEMGVSVTFVSEGEVGTKWFLDDRREQIMKSIAESNGANGRLNNWILRQLPDDVAVPGLRIARP
jgi:hypothetical protein